MKKYIACFLVFCICATMMPVDMIAASSSKLVEGCPVGMHLNSSLTVRSSAIASSSCSGHMTSVFLYAYNSVTGESGKSNPNWNPTEAMNYVSETVTLSVPPTYAHSEHGAWCTTGEGYAVEELTEYGS